MHCVIKIPLKRIAIVERLAFGSSAHGLSHIRIRREGRLKFLEDWSVAEAGNNVMMYFLALVYMSIIGFAGLYAGINAASPHDFVSNGGRSGISWLYFSVATMATLGDSDIDVRSTLCQVAVIAQLATGPLVFSWLVAVFTSSELPTTRADEGIPYSESDKSVRRET